MSSRPGSTPGRIDEQLTTDQEGAIVAEPLEAPLPIANPQGPDIQHQIDDLRLALQAWRQSREYAQPTQSRLEQLTLQCARLVDAWQQTERRRNGGPAALAGTRDENGGIEQGLERATGDRIQALERAIEQEWEALRNGPDDPAQKLTEQAASLAESCVAAANLALRGFANAESRVAALEAEIKTGMSQLSRDLQSILGELRSARTTALPGANPAFPLESVMRIHQELRESDSAPAPETKPLPAVPPRALPEEAESTRALAARIESLERAVSSSSDRHEPAAGSVEEAAAPPRAGWWPWIAAAGVIAALAGTAFVGLWQQRRIDTRLNEAALQVEAAERQRDATVAAARDEAARQVADAQRAAAQAQIVSSVLAAPDLVRYWLRGTGQYASAYAQVHFSRSRGAVFSATRLQPAAADRTYQLWLLTRTGPVNAGLVTPDDEGRATLAIDDPIALSGRLTGAVVTLEPKGGRPEPTGEPVLTRITGN